MADTKGQRSIQDTTSPPSLAIEQPGMISPKLSSPDYSFRSSQALEKPCEYSRVEFCDVVLNLIKNPNITSSHLFRADICWDSDKDTTFQPAAVSSDEDLGGFIKHMRPECRPWKIQVEGFELQRTIVRQLIPRNQQLDKALFQTCHFFEAGKGDDCIQRVLIIFLPHQQDQTQIPWYHPPFRAIAFCHSSAGDVQSKSDTEVHLNSFSIHYSPFIDAASGGEDERTSRTLKNLLNTIHKHAISRLTGYVKRVHHDRVVPQKSFQDTYARLKSRHAKDLVSSWREQTNVTKGVFEDLGIAAFLIELWKEMYADSCHSTGEETQPRDGEKSERDESSANVTAEVKPPFPGFVDIGCGNGLLVYILIQEGYRGWGFDARLRKTWSAFPQRVQDALQEMTLVPSVMELKGHGSALGNIQNGHFDAQTFIISNHADELTPWTPLLAYMNESPFISIPCCSHDLTGSRHRFGAGFGREMIAEDEFLALERLKLRENVSLGSLDARRKAPRADSSTDASLNAQDREARDCGRPAQSNEGDSRAPSAYATLCGYLAHLCRELDYVPEKEILRIPSTRNVCIVGRHRTNPQSSSVESANGDHSSKRERLRMLIQREMRMPLEEVATIFVEKATGVYRSKSRDH